MNIEDAYIGNRGINSRIISEDSLEYIKKIFNSYDIRSDDYAKFDPLNHMYLLTCWVDTNDPEAALRQFSRMNTQLMWNIAGRKDFYSYIPCQHVGVTFIDCLGSKRGQYVHNMYGLHSHSVFAVHPDWESRFRCGVRQYELDRFAAMDFERWKIALKDSRQGMHIKKIDPTEEDALRAISYSAKALMNHRGVYHGRDNLYEFTGPNQNQKDNKILFRKSRDIIHRVNPDTLTQSNSNRMWPTAAACNSSL